MYSRYVLSWLGRLRLHERYTRGEETGIVLEARTLLGMENLPHDDLRLLSVKQPSHGDPTGPTSHFVLLAIEGRSDTSRLRATT